MPAVFEPFGVNTALWPAGKLARLADSDVIALPSASDAVTFTASAPFSLTVAVDGATTTGARSPFVTVMTVVAEPVRAFVAVNVTLNVPV